MRHALINARGNKRQEDVAKGIGISQKYLSALELQKRDPSFRTAIKISEYYKIPMRELFLEMYPSNSSYSSTV